MLLSQSVQAKMGFLKNARTGGISLMDYNNQTLEVARQINTGLFMIRIDHFAREDVERSPSLKKLKINREGTTSPQEKKGDSLLATIPGEKKDQEDTCEADMNYNGNPSGPVSYTHLTLPTKA